MRVWIWIPLLILSLALQGCGKKLQVSPVVKIGDINSYRANPEAATAFRNGWQLALEQANSAGGIQGRPIEVISRDDQGDPEHAVTEAKNLVSSEGVVMLMGTSIPEVSLAVSDYAALSQTIFMVGQTLNDELVWGKSARHTFRIPPPVYAQTAMLAEEAIKLPVRQWVTLAPDTPFGREAVESFKQLVRARRPGMKWIGEQWVPAKDFNVQETIREIIKANPDAIFNATTGETLVRIVLEGKKQGAFKNRQVVSLLTGEPENLNALGWNTPVGWLVTGYPWYSLSTPEHKIFFEDYQKRYNEPPLMNSVLGYITMQSIVSILKRAGSTDTGKMISAAERARVNTPFGPISFRRLDHQSTLGAYIGRTGIRDIRGVMTDWRYGEGKNYLPRGSKMKKLIKK